MFFTKTSALILALANLSASTAFAVEKAKELPVLKAKQSLDNIRFISKNGKYTYYQRRSGDLQLSTNYSNELVLEGKKLTEYLVTGSQAGKRLVISKDPRFHTQMSHLKEPELFVAEFGTAKISKAGTGVAPKLHQNDSLISSYSPATKTLKIQRLLGPKKTVAIKLFNPVNDHFIPQAHMPTPNDVIYSDINEKGFEGFLMRSILDQKSQTVYKAAYPGSKVQGCLDENNLYVGEFERGSGRGGSKIVKIPLFNNKDFQSSEVIYHSQQADIGNMVCAEGKIYFIKTMSFIEELNLKETEVAVLDLKTRDVSVLSSLKRVTQLVDMDGMILAPFRGNYYIIEGSANVANDEIKKDKR